MPGAATSPASDEMLTMEAGAAALRCGMACLQPSITERRLISNCRCQFSTVSSSAKARGPPTPALLTSTDRPPRSRAATSTTRAQSSSQRTSWA